MALTSLHCAEVPLRNCSLTQMELHLIAIECQLPYGIARCCCLILYWCIVIFYWFKRIVIVFMSDIWEMSWRWRTVCTSSRWLRCTDLPTASERQKHSSSTISSQLLATMTSAASRVTCSVSFCQTIDYAPSRNLMCSKLHCRGSRRQFLRHGKRRRQYGESWVLCAMAWWVLNRWSAYIVTRYSLERLAVKCFR